MANFAESRLPNPVARARASEECCWMKSLSNWARRDSTYCWDASWTSSAEVSRYSWTHLTQWKLVHSQFMWNQRFMPPLPVRQVSLGHCPRSFWVDLVLVAPQHCLGCSSHNWAGLCTLDPKSESLGFWWLSDFPFKKIGSHSCWIIWQFVKR